MSAEADKSAQNTKLLDENTLAAVADIPIFSEAGEQVNFASLYADKKTVVVFIRHFFCGLCQSYLSELAKVPKEAFEAANTNIAVVGCGEWTLIKQYREDTEFPYPVYANPSRKLYQELGLISSLAGPPKDEPPKSYIGSVVSIVAKSTWRGLKSPFSSITGKGGSISQLGGDFVLGPGNHCSFASRMRWVTDHMDVPDLMKVAGVQYPE